MKAGENKQAQAHNIHVTSSHLCKSVFVVFMGHNIRSLGAKRTTDNNDDDEDDDDDERRRNIMCLLLHRHSYMCR